MSDKSHFDIAHHPFPKNAQGRTFFDDFTSYQRLAQWFQLLVEEPGLGVLTADPGVGKTAAIRNLCGQLPNPDYLIVYMCNTSVSPLDLYRTLATELGLRPSHRRGQLWSDIKQALVQMVDERGTSPVVVIDEAQLLSDAFLLDLSGFLNFAFDSRELLTLWLVGPFVPTPEASPTAARGPAKPDRRRVASRASGPGDLRGRANAHFQERGMPTKSARRARH